MNKFIFVIFMVIGSIFPVSALQIFSENELKTMPPQEESKEESQIEEEAMVDPLEMDELLPQELQMRQ